MTEDARFEDGGDRPLRLMAWDADDLGVLAALAQDAIFPASEMRWLPKERRFAVLLNRFRWEDAPAAELRGRPVERVQALLVVADVMRVRSMGIESRDPDTILSLLDISFTQGGDGTGTVELTLAGDGAVALDVETLDVTLRDVTRPYVAPSGAQPKHPD